MAHALTNRALALTIALLVTACGGGRQGEGVHDDRLNGEWDLVLTALPTDLTARAAGESATARGTLAFLPNRAGALVPNFKGMPQQVGTHNLQLGGLVPELGPPAAPPMAAGASAGDSVRVVIDPASAEPIILRGSWQGGEVAESGRLTSARGSIGEADLPSDDRRRNLSGMTHISGAGAEPSFADLVRTRDRGKLKVYIGSAAGVGKTYRMLNEAHALRGRGVDLVVGFVETHGRTETEGQVLDLEVVPRRRIEYRGVVLEEMDVDAIIARRPQVVVVDELAHTNVPGAGRGKRWEDVVALLDEGISVISAVNVQHLESLNDVIQETLGVTVRETVPDWVVGMADQVINLDISAEDLRQRLVEGKIYAADKVPTALNSFFTQENLTTLRELALREVASSVDRSREAIVSREVSSPAARRTVDRVLVGMSSNPEYTARLLRKASRIAGRLNPDWYCVYVQTPEESPTRIDATVQRKLVENIQRAQAMGAEVEKIQSEDIPGALLKFAREKKVSLIIVGQSRLGWWRRMTRGPVIERLANNEDGIDVLVVSLEREKDEP